MANDGKWFVLFPLNRMPEPAAVQEALANVIETETTKATDDVFKLAIQRGLHITLNQHDRVIEESKDIARNIVDDVDGYLRKCDARFMIRYDRRAEDVHALVLRVASRLRRLTGGAIIDAASMTLVQAPDSDLTL